MTVFINFFFKIFAFFLAVSVFFILLVFLGSFFTSDTQIIKKNNFVYKDGNKDSPNIVALIKLSGPILNEPMNAIEFSFIDNIQAIYVSEVKKDLNELQSSKVKGLIIVMDSPGGSVSATYNLYETIEEFKEKNNVKVYTFTNEILASGGYWAALASDKIFAGYGSLIGSIGVRGPDWIYYDNPTSISTGILGETVETQNGIKKYNTIAGESKDLFNSFRQPTNKEIKSLKNIVNEIYFDFVTLVSKKRNIENNFIIEDLGALIFDPKNASKNFLIDDILNLKEVENKIVKDLKLSDYKIIQKNKNIGFFKNIVQSSMSMTKNLDIIKKNKICDIINGTISIILINQQSMKNC